MILRRLRMLVLFAQSIYGMLSFSVASKDVVDMVRVKKRDGRIEDFVESKIEASVKKAGATAEQAAQVVKIVAKKVANKAEVSAARLSGYVVTALRKINKKAADAYVAYRNRKLKQKEKKK